MNNAPDQPSELPEFKDGARRVVKKDDSSDETVVAPEARADATRSTSDGIAPDAPAVPSPSQVGRYRIDRVLGKGGFGVVYLGHDDQLQRPVAIKVPHPHRMTAARDAGAYLAEARTVAALEHANIVPVYDVGQSDDFPLFVVSKFVDGTDLRRRLTTQRFDPVSAAELTATIAEALHFAHKRGIVHRDVKPANILLDKRGQAHLADFGLALRERDLKDAGRYVGTPKYMSPEQVRGEGHRVDGRSDLFSLGVVFYELLTGRRPFDGESQQDLLLQIVRQEAKPPRQIDDTIPKELERICLKALSKRARDRYTTAKDFAYDLRMFSSDPANSNLNTNVGSFRELRDQDTKTEGNTPQFRPDSDSRPIRIIPKGLRSFDAHDADFFLELLPGPRDRDGLPDNLRFWKTRIEEMDPAATFAVGLIYGPSGCGKSSLVQAGLLPRLSGNVISVYVEATPEDTETRLLNGLHKCCPTLDRSLTLTDSLTHLRRGECLPRDQKVLIVLDQFEQWLYAHKEHEATELADALRQCDGGHVQCILMVRDEFWLAVSRFLRELEVRLVEGQNVALADLFDQDHARRVLAAFGRAFGKLPEDSSQTSAEQKRFLSDAVSGLAEEGRIVCVRLSLFAEMMKSRDWIPATLQQVGGTHGLGMTFLEETFSSSRASPDHRLHQAAARRVLNALLPDSGTDIKGEMKSHAELIDISGYSANPREFDDLIRILDGELRLITPTDPEGVASEEWRVKGEEPAGSSELQTTHHPPPATLYYQLTHDYLVPSLREWLTRKQKETRRGRAELKLAERAALWQAKPEKRHLPSLWEWAGIRLLTDGKKWTEPQRRMMRKAGRIHLAVWGTAVATLVIVAIAIRGYAARVESAANRERTQTAVTAVATAPGIAAPFAMKELDELPPEIVLAELRSRFETASGQQRLLLAYGLSHVGDVRIDATISGLVDRNTQPAEMMNVVTALNANKTQAVTSLKETADRLTESADWQLKVRCAIAALHLGDSSIATDMFRAFPEPSQTVKELQTTVSWDPIQRTTLIREFPAWRGELKNLISVVQEANAPDLTSGLSLALGSTIPPDDQGVKASLTETLERWYRESTDGGTHSASRWALAHWGIELPEVTPTESPQPDLDWWHATEDLCLVRVSPGAVASDDEVIRVQQEFWMSDCEITIALFQQFMDDKDYAGLKPQMWDGPVDFRTLTAGVQRSHPVQHVNWYDAVMFCNWLNAHHGLTPCYAITPKEEPSAFGVEWLRDAGGYRLPTEEEWEYACRALTTTEFASSDDVEDLEDYAFNDRNSTGAGTTSVGSLKCNAFGLFGMHGNVAEWCWDGDGSDRVTRGGGWRNTSRHCRSAFRLKSAPSYRNYSLGFRVLLSSGQSASNQ
jgi:eukaryotic-like serine/threonine-protein kinase